MSSAPVESCRARHSGIWRRERESIAYASGESDGPKQTRGTDDKAFVDCDLSIARKEDLEASAAPVVVEDPYGSSMPVDDPRGDGEPESRS